MRPLKILLICAHPGDAFDDSGGTLCHHVERGDQVTVVLVTTGVRSHAALFMDEKNKPIGQRVEKLAQATSEEIRNFKAEEVRRAGAELGITDIRLLFEEDDILLVNPPIIRKISHLIRQEKPDLLITHHPMAEGGLLGTHPQIGQIVLLALESCSRWLRDEDLPPHQVSQVFFIGGGIEKRWSISKTMNIVYDVYVDVTDTIERKVRALDHLKSQRYDGVYARKRMETADGHFGEVMEIPYAEVFIRHVPDVYYYLPLEERSLSQGKGWTDRMNRVSKIVAPYVPMPESPPQTPGSTR
ncbi:MAG: PIG-L family deacetylase [Planctomycetota bacterium]